MKYRYNHQNYSKEPHRSSKKLHASNFSYEIVHATFVITTFRNNEAKRVEMQRKSSAQRIPTTPHWHFFWS